ncbi:MAG: sigma-70 family RNA polymerase sigma factor [Pirellulaceae bacterium]|nr:sigma-70 family RNA polymerase sigma factor [Pirellulaceae bacterium]
MLRVRDDDAEAYRNLVMEYQPRLLRLLRHAVGSPALAEDLTQDVFLRVWRARKSYQPSAKFRTWIFHIASNVAKNSLRDNSRIREFQLGGKPTGSGWFPSLDHVVTTSTSTMPARKLDKVERAEMVHNAVQALNQRQRTALILAKFENMSYQEIADTMGLSVKAVKSLLCRARINLKTLLQPYLDEGQLPDSRKLP